MGSKMAGVTHTTCGRGVAGTTVSLCDLLLTRATPERIRDEHRTYKALDRSFALVYFIVVP